MKACIAIKDTIIPDFYVELPNPIPPYYNIAIPYIKDNADEDNMSVLLLEIESIFFTHILEDDTLIIPDKSQALKVKAIATLKKPENCLTWRDIHKIISNNIIKHEPPVSDNR